MAGRKVAGRKVVPNGGKKSDTDNLWVWVMSSVPTIPIIGIHHAKIHYMEHILLAKSLAASIPLHFMLQIFTDDTLK